MGRVELIQNARVLDVEAVPSEILRRNAELNALSNAPDPLLHADHGDYSIIYDSTGTGKTACHATRPRGSNAKS